MQLKKFYQPSHGKELHRTVVVDGTRIEYTVAEKLVPDKYRQENIKPMKTKGDGNCLFNAASIALCGAEKLSAELRMRTINELVENLHFYKSHLY